LFIGHNFFTYFMGDYFHAKFEVFSINLYKVMRWGQKTENLTIVSRTDCEYSIKLPVDCVTCFNDIFRLGE